MLEYMPNMIPNCKKYNSKEQKQQKKGHKSKFSPRIMVINRSAKSIHHSISPSSPKSPPITKKMDIQLIFCQNNETNQIADGRHQYHIYIG